MKYKPAVHFTRTAAWEAVPMCGSTYSHTLVVKNVTCLSCLHLIGKCNPATCRNRACQAKRIKRYAEANSGNPFNQVEQRQ